MWMTVNYQKRKKKKVTDVRKEVEYDKLPVSVTIQKNKKTRQYWLPSDAFPHRQSTTTFGVGNPLFSQAKSLMYILTFLFGLIDYTKLI